MRLARRLAGVLASLATMSVILGTALANSPVHTPIAAFIYNPCVMCAAPGNVVFFSANYSTTPAGAIVSYTWNFGDGAPSLATNSSTTTHMYGGQPGQWKVTLTVEDPNHQTDTITQLVIFNIAPRFTFQPSSPETGQAVTFNASSTIIYFQPPQSPKEFWNFGDGTNATGTIVQHIYNTVGVYRIALSSITVNGTATISETIRVRPDPPPVSAAGGRAAT